MFFSCNSSNWGCLVGNTFLIELQGRELPGKNTSERAMCFCCHTCLSKHLARNSNEVSSISRLLILSLLLHTSINLIHMFSLSFLSAWYLIFLIVCFDKLYYLMSFFLILSVFFHFFNCIFHLWLTKLITEGN